MKNLSNKYLKSLENYLEWERCKTPMGNFAATLAASGLPHVDLDGETSPEEWIFTYESHGVLLSHCNDLVLLNKYWTGKSNRDWWTKEIGKFKKLNSPFIPEEFMNLLTPLCFIELYDRSPITRLVRYYHDNSYSTIDFQMDSRIQSYCLNNDRIWYFDIDPKDSWIKTLYRLVKVTKIDPWVWKFKLWRKSCY